MSGRIWIGVDEALPGIAEGWLSCSRNVEIKLEDGSITYGYYVHEKKDPRWLDENSKPIDKAVVAWRNESKKARERRKRYGYVGMG